MLMSRQQYHSNPHRPADKNMNITFRQQLQHNPVKQLLSTAATGTGVVGDVDALLQPIDNAPQSSVPSPKLVTQDCRPERNLWRTEEIMEMLKVMQELGSMELLNDKTVKSEKVFLEVEKIMNKRGFCKKSHVQIWTKWKFLKSTYMTSKRNCVIPKMIPYPIYEVLGKMLSGGSSDCDNSITSYDGDNSNGPTAAVVEGSKKVNKTNSIDATNESEEDNDFGMAHPIFGFRLGMVKNEPADLGYENCEKDPSVIMESNANSSCSSSQTAQEHFETDIKQEIEDAFSSESPPSTPMLEPQIEITPGKKNLPEISATPTNNNPVPVQIQAALPPNPQMPPLRIAPFAKVSGSMNGNNAINRNPPPLAMQPHRKVGRPPMMQHKLPIQNMSPGNLTMRPLRLPMHLASGQQHRLNHSSSHMSATSSMPRLKYVPIRKTPYSLRPDRMIPDLDGSVSPPPLAPHSQISMKSTFQQHEALLNSQKNFVHQNRILPTHPMTGKILDKRRVEHISPIGNVPKMPRLATKEYEDNMMKAHRQSFQDSMRQQQSTPSVKSIKSNSRSKEYFEDSLRDFSNSMRQMQKELMQDFFKKQKELARKEHQFQMQQDRLIMQSFEEQTRKLMKSAREILGVEVGGIMKKSCLKNGVSYHRVKQDIEKAENETSEIEQQQCETVQISNETAEKEQNLDEIEEQDETQIEEGDEEENEELEDQEIEEQHQFCTNEYMHEASFQNENIHEESEMDDDNDDSQQEETNEEGDDSFQQGNEDDQNSEIDDPIHLVSSELVED